MENPPAERPGGIHSEALPESELSYFFREDRDGSMHMLQRRIQYGAGRSLPDTFKRSRTHNILPEMRSESHSEEREIRTEIAPGRRPDHMVPEAWSGDIHGDGQVHHRLSGPAPVYLDGTGAADKTVGKQPDSNGLARRMVDSCELV